VGAVEVVALLVVVKVVEEVEQVCFKSLHLLSRQEHTQLQSVLVEQLVNQRVLVDGLEFLLSEANMQVEQVADSVGVVLLLDQMLVGGAGMGGAGATRAAGIGITNTFTGTSTTRAAGGLGGGTSGTFGGSAAANSGTGGGGAIGTSSGGNGGSGLVSVRWKV